MEGAIPRFIVDKILMLSGILNTMSRCQRRPLLLSSLSAVVSILKLQEALTRLKSPKTKRFGFGRIVGSTWVKANIVHVLDFHYLGPDGKDLTDDERTSFEILDSETSVLDSSRKGTSKVYPVSFMET